jgi:myo-inositol-1(or 4)-monophosphatase
MASGSRSRPEELLTIARDAAEQAGAILVAATPGQRAPHNPGGEDLVTDLDFAAEASIRESILSRRPDDGFVGEELGTIPSSSGVEWLVDPIDGTTNYVAGIPQWATSIAARIDDRVEAAVVHAPELERTYTALTDTGAWQDESPISPHRAQADSLEQAIVATGFSAHRALRSDQLDQLRRVLDIVRDVRSHGAASLDLCSVASGEVDAYFESALSVWDIAAGALIATESSIDVSGSPWSGEGALVAASPTLAKSLRLVIEASVFSRGASQ